MKISSAAISAGSAMNAPSSEGLAVDTQPAREQPNEQENAEWKLEPLQSHSKNLRSALKALGGPARATVFIGPASVARLTR